MKKNKSGSVPANAPKAVFHGECFVFESALPVDSVKEKIEGNVVIIAESEVTGNHHVIDRKPGVEFFRSKDGKTRYMQNSEPAQIRCVIAERHTAIDLKPGVWEFGIAEEFDYKSEAKRRVAD